MVLIIIIVNIITILNIQVNQITSYLDGSNLYGSSSTDQVLILDIYYSLFFIILSQVKILDISYSLFINDSSFIINLPLTSTGWDCSPRGSCSTQTCTSGWRKPRAGGEGGKDGDDCGGDGEFDDDFGGDDGVFGDDRGVYGETGDGCGDYGEGANYCGGDY